LRTAPRATVFPSRRAHRCWIISPAEAAAGLYRVSTPWEMFFARSVVIASRHGTVRMTQCRRPRRPCTDARAARANRAY
jgi:hypothetical protein